RQPAAWERARDAVLARTIRGKGPLRGAFLSLLTQAREFPRLREDTHFYFGLPLPTERRAVLELARRLVAAGVLAPPEDVFHLTLDELEGVGQPWPPPAHTVERLRAAVARRTARREALPGPPFAEPR